MWWILALLTAFHGLCLCWYSGVHPLTWLGIPETLSLLMVTTGWLVWSLLLGLSWTTCFWVSRWGLQKLPYGLGWLAVPFIWIWGSWLWAHLPFYLPWADLGVLLGWLPFLNVLPDYVLTGLGGLALTLGLTRFTPVSRHTVIITAALAGLALAGYVYTLVFTAPVAEQALEAHQQTIAGWPAPVYLMQGNVPIATIRGANPGEGFEKYYRYLENSPAPAGTVWLMPEEGALPGIVPLVQPKAQQYFNRYQILAAQRHWWIVAGATTQDENGRLFNTMLTIQPDAYPQFVHKRFLVPFGETAPFGLADLTERLTGYNPQFSAGSVIQKPVQIRFKEAQLTLWPLICSELLYDELWPDAADLSNHTGIIVSSANLGWFQQRNNPLLGWWWRYLLQHRARKKQMPVLSVANQGPSFIINSQDF